MKTLITALMGAFLLAACLAQVSKPVPKGIRQADQAEGQGERSIPPPRATSPRVNASHLQEDANNLAELAESISAEVAQVNRGTLPKDLIEKLKRIEKLSKHLRTEIAP